MDTLKKHASWPDASPQCVSFRRKSEDEQLAQLIKLFDLAPVLLTPKVISVTGDTKTDFYERQDPTSALFDPTYPKPIGGRRSARATRRYWTEEILRWRIRQAARDRG